MPTLPFIKAMASEVDFKVEAAYSRERSFQLFYFLKKILDFLHIDGSIATIVLFVYQSIYLSQKLTILEISLFIYLILFPYLFQVAR